MRYWVYQDSRILGPYGKEDLPTVEGLHAGSLVCPDNHSGTQEMDWAPLDSYQELSGVFGAAAETVAEAAAAVGSFDRFATEAHSSLERIGSSENWMETIQKDPRLSDLWGTLPEDLGPEKHWELHQSSDLENRLAELQAKLEAQESRQNEILDRLNEKDRLLSEKDRKIAQLESRLRMGGAAAEPAAFETRPARATEPEPEAAAPAEPRMRAPAGPELVPFADDMDSPEPVSRREPVESGDAVSDGPLEGPPADSDGPLILDEPAMEAGIPNIAATPAEPEDSGFAAPVLEEPAAEPMAAAPALEAFEPPVPDEVPSFEAPVPGAGGADEFGIPEATPLKSVSEMPPPLEFEAPIPGEEDAFGAEAVGAGIAMGAAGAAAFEEEAPALEAPPLEGEDFGAPPLEAPELEAPAFDAADGPPMPDFTAPGAGQIPLDPPPGDESGFGVPAATPETIDLSAPVEPVPAAQAQPPLGDDPFAAPKTMMMGGIPTPAPSDDLAGGGLNLTPPPMSAPGQGSGLGPMPNYPMGATPEPIPLGEGDGMMGTPPPTPMPSMGQPDLPQTVMAGLGVSGMPTPMPSQYPTPQPATGGFQDMMGGQGAPTPLPSIPGAEPPHGGPMTMTPNPAYTPVPTGGPGAEPATVPPSGAPAKVSAVQKIKARVGKIGGKKFLIGLVVAVAVLAGLLFMFLKNPKEVVKMAEMGPEQKTRGSFDVDPDAMGAPGGAQPSANTGGPSPFDRAPAQQPQAMPQQAAPQAPSAQPQAAAPAFPQREPEPEAPPAAAPEPRPAPAAPPRREFIQDQRIEAIEFVKGYRIAGGKEVVAQRLQYYFLGGDNVPEWQAGAVEKNKWIVEYNVFKGRGAGGRRSKPTVTYQFEVDLAAKSIKGLNGRARDLIGGSQAPQKRVSRRNTRRGGQTPLPSDEELSQARSTGSGGFNNPGE